MANLKIEKKKKFPVFWIILVIIIVGVIAWLLIDNYGMWGRNESTQAPYESYDDQGGLSGTDTLRDNYYGENSGDVNAAPMNRRVDEFVSFAEETDSASLTLETTNEGLTKLYGALAAVSPADSLGTSGQQDLDKLKSATGQLNDNRLEKQHSTILKNTFIDAAKRIQNVQDQHYPELRHNSNNLMAAATSIKEQTPLKAQKAEIKTFFDEAALALEQMQNKSPATSGVVK